MSAVGDKKRWMSLIASLAITFIVAVIGSQFLPDEWFRDLKKPSFNPPDAVFGPVWTVLYILMAIAAWMVWRRRQTMSVTGPLALYGIQLVLNAFWSWLFFGRHQIGLALVEVVLLWIVLLLTTTGFWRVSRPAGIILIPYLAWVSFAAVLNASFWHLNG